MTNAVERMLPLYEGKMGHQYDYRAASFVGARDTDIVPNADRSLDAVVLPRYWVRESVVEDRLERRAWGTESALLGFRRVARNTDERTVIAALIPYGAASYGWIISAGPDAQALALLAAQYNSYCFDFVLRQFLSQPSIPQGTFEQAPVLTPEQFDRHDRWLGQAKRWVARRALWLSVTGGELAHLGTETGTPVVQWSGMERVKIRTELDAAMFHLCGVDRDDVDYIMETFPIVKRKDEAAHGEYRTKRLILETYDAMAEAIESGTAYLSPFDEE